MYQIAIIEDNSKIGKVISDFVIFQPDMELVLHAVSYEEFISKWNGRKLDLVLCDIGLLGKSGIDAAWYIKSHSPGSQVIMFTVFEDKAKIFSALCAGASGYILKSASLADILKGMKDVLNGGAAMSPSIARQVAEFFYERSTAGKDQAPLSSRETEIIFLVRQGLSNKEVAEKLFISQDTVKFHIKNIYQKLQISSRSELILHYQEGTKAQ